ncbi:MAG: hypothetical protein JW924_11965 [Fusobacteriaceae bacterium]|nr:hypothetical protein [Fusobacteriaceae bacterium]
MQKIKKKKDKQNNQREQIDVTTENEVRGERVEKVRIAPKVYEGRTIDCINVYPDRITGGTQLQAAEIFAGSKYINTGILQNNMMYAVILSQFVCDVDEIFIRKLPGHEFNELIMTIQGLAIAGV